MATAAGSGAFSPPHSRGSVPAMDAGLGGDKPYLTLTAWGHTAVSARNFAAAGGSTVARPSADQLLGELASARYTQRSAETQAALADRESERLAGQAVRREAEMRAMRLEIGGLRAKIAELERINIQLTNLLDEAHMNLKQVTAREHELSRNAVERQLRTAEAENRALLARSEADERRIEAQRLRTALADKCVDFETLAEQLRASRGLPGGSGAIDSAALAVDRATAPQPPRPLEAAAMGAEDFAAAARQAEAELEKAEKAVLKAELQSCKEALELSCNREAALAAELERERGHRERMEDINGRLRVDLQEVMAQAVRGGERPYYYGCAASAIGLATGEAACVPAPPAFGSQPPWKNPGSSQRGDSPSSVASPTLRPALRSPKCRVPLQPLSPEAKGTCWCPVLDRRKQALDAIDRLSEAPNAG